VDTSSTTLFSIISSLGGENGWLYGNRLLRLRCLIDKIVGGTGYRKGRPSGDNLKVGDKIDFWTVEKYIFNKVLLLSADIKLWGRGWMEYKVKPVDDNRKSSLTLTAYFYPNGVMGYLYWYSILFIHKFVFNGMVRSISQAALSTYSKGV
jgi:hypothetical protein